jgi:hypothetical protein
MAPYVILPAGTAPPIGRSEGVYSTQRPPGFLAREIDPKTGEITSLFRAPHPVDAAMQFQARAVEGSGPALAGQGTRYARIQYGLDSAKAEYNAETRRWTRRFVDRQLIELKLIQSDVDDDTGAAFVAYRNRMTGQEENASAESVRNT